MDFRLVAVHGGAGFHDKSDASKRELKRCLRLACKRALASLEGGTTALIAVECAIKVMEDDPCLNAGFGSNLTLDGTVECDAAVMDGHTGDFGAVGAASGIKNPVLAASAVLQRARESDPLGRIPPLLLVSHGATSFARKQGIACVPPETMVAPRALADWKTWSSRLETTTAGTSKELTNDSGRNALRERQDTVGAIALDASRGLAAGVSSGGLLLKYPGRVGEAAVFGAGCWAQQDSSVGTSVACSVSGSGEYIVRCMLAKTVADAVLHASGEDVHDILHRSLSDFCDACRARNEPDPNAGILLVVQEREPDDGQTTRLWCAFTTDSMAVAYVSTLNAKPTSLVLRKDPGPHHRDMSSIYITALPLTD